MSVPALAVDGLTVRYGALTALDDVGLRLAPGTACGLVGPNGSGKSTLLAAVLGLVRPVAGSISVLGGTCGAARTAGRLGYVPQSDRVDPDFPVSVADVVLAGRYRRTHRRPDAVDRRQADRALAQVGLADVAGRPFGALSGGQRQRVLLARALTQEPEVLLLDEPFSGLDLASAAATTQALQAAVAGGTAVLVASHDLGWLPQLCRRTVLLSGRVLADGPTADVLTAEQVARAFGLEPGGGR